VAPLLDARIWLMAAAIFALNLPFGYWRGGLPKLSAWWFVAIHAPVPIIVLLRLTAGVPFRWSTLPLFVLAFFLGQSGGARVRKTRMLAGAQGSGGNSLE
jgi:hypothetical protein